MPRYLTWHFLIIPFLHVQCVRLLSEEWEVTRKKKLMHHWDYLHILLTSIRSFRYYILRHGRWGENQTSIGIVSIYPVTIPQLSISLQLSCLLCLVHSFVSPLDIIFLLQTFTSHRVSDSVGMRETYHGPCLTA
ncbi:hypothetical protein F4776DRAFT_260530 [Hypoxylon sp. NC0597]|nr:hypothetical protein F4776DRAFT_260530 [Hypoxylon sp. NC0597]